MTKKYLIAFLLGGGALGLLTLCLSAAVLFSIAGEAHKEWLANRPIEYAPDMYDRWEDAEGFLEFSRSGTFTMGSRGKSVTGTLAPWNSNPPEWFLETIVDGVTKREKFRIELDHDKLTTWDEKGKKRVFQRKKQK